MNSLLILWSDEAKYFFVLFEILKNCVSAKQLKRLKSTCLRKRLSSCLWEPRTSIRMTKIWSEWYAEAERVRILSILKLWFSSICSSRSWAGTVENTDLWGLGLQLTLPGSKHNSHSPCSSNSDILDIFLRAFRFLNFERCSFNVR